MSVAERVKFVLETFAAGRHNAMRGEFIAALSGSKPVYVRAVCSRLRAEGFPVRASHARRPRGYWWEVAPGRGQRQLPIEVQRAAASGDMAAVRRYARAIAEEVARRNRPEPAQVSGGGGNFAGQLDLM